MKTRNTSDKFLIIPNGSLGDGMVMPIMLRKLDNGRWTYDLMACEEGAPWNYEAVCTGEDSYDSPERAFEAWMDGQNG